MPSTQPDPFLMGNLKPEQTGLPFVVWFSQSGGFGDDLRVWVSHSPKAIPSDMASVAIRPNVRVVDGELSASHLELLTKWVELNLAVLDQYWDGEIGYTGDVIEVLRPLKT